MITQNYKMSKVGVAAMVSFVRPHIIIVSRPSLQQVFTLKFLQW